MAVPDVVAAAKDADILVFVVPHQFIKKLCDQLAGNIKATAIGLSLIKVDTNLQVLSLLFTENGYTDKSYNLVGLSFGTWRWHRVDFSRHQSEAQHPRRRVDGCQPGA